MLKKICISIIALFALVSCSGSSTDVINPDAEYLYFYGATCPHCQELNRKLEEVGGIEQFSVEKREVYYNSKNNTLFLETAKKFDIAQSELAVPFVIHKETGKYVIGVEPGFEAITSSSQKSGEESSTGVTIEE